MTEAYRKCTLQAIRAKGSVIAPTPVIVKKEELSSSSDKIQQDASHGDDLSQTLLALRASMKREHRAGIKIEQKTEVKEPKKEDPDEEKPYMIKPVVAGAQDEDELDDGELVHGSLDEMEREMVNAAKNEAWRNKKRLKQRGKQRLVAYP